MGWLTDNTRSSFGRRKPYMAAGTVIYNLMLFLLLNPPRTLEHPSVSHWFGLTYTLFFFADTFTTIPYFAVRFEIFVF
jgi:GPH family glycoside/pentoside/hexuronide:cation symporter